MHQDMKSRASGDAREAEAEAQRASENPVLEFAARAGFVVRGLLYLTMGVLALGLAVGRSGATDQKGSLKLLTGLAGNPGGAVLLGAIAAALAGYALWNFLSAAFDPLGERGRGSAGRRLASLGSGVAYTALLLFCVQLMFGRSDGGTSDSTVPGVVASLLSTPVGPWLAGLAGLGAVAVGVAQVAQAARSSPDKDLETEDMSEKERRAALTLRRFGAAARGGVLIVLGWFVLQAAVFRDPHRAKGMGGAFGALAQQPAGRVLLAVLALGFVALALYSFAAARWMRARSGPRRAAPSR
jgi:hypothetical protein